MNLKKMLRVLSNVKSILLLAHCTVDADQLNHRMH